MTTRTVRPVYAPVPPLADKLSLAEPTRYVCVDLGQASDFTAITVLTPAGYPGTIYSVGHIERVQLRTSYTRIRDHVAGVCSKLAAPTHKAPDPVRLGGGVMRIVQAKPAVFLLLDYTGVGHPVLDMFLEARDGDATYGGTRMDPDVVIVPITIHGGDKVGRGPEGLSIPKRELASSVQRVLQDDRLIIPEGDPMTPLLTGELGGFRAKISATGHDSYAAAEDWRSGNPGNHDDLVLSLALGIWYGEATWRGE